MRKPTTPTALRLINTPIIATRDKAQQRQRRVPMPTASPRSAVWANTLHGEGSGQKIVGRVLAKGLAGDEMGDRLYLDGIDNNQASTDRAGIWSVSATALSRSFVSRLAKSEGKDASGRWKVNAFRHSVEQ